MQVLGLMFHAKKGVREGHVPPPDFFFYVSGCISKTTYYNFTDVAALRSGKFWDFFASKAKNSGWWVQRWLYCNILLDKEFLAEGDLIVDIDIYIISASVSKRYSA
jgi:hypothetical protein